MLCCELCRTDSAELPALPLDLGRVAGHDGGARVRGGLSGGSSAKHGGTATERGEKTWRPYGLRMTGNEGKGRSGISGGVFEAQHSAKGSRTAREPANDHHHHGTRASGSHTHRGGLYGGLGNLGSGGTPGKHGSHEQSSARRFMGQSGGGMNGNGTGKLGKVGMIGKAGAGSKVSGKSGSKMSSGKMGSGKVSGGKASSGKMASGKLGSGKLVGSIGNGGKAGGNLSSSVKR